MIIIIYKRKKNELKKEIANIRNEKRRGEK